VWLGRAIPGHSVEAGVLASFLWEWSRLGGAVSAAWENTRTGYSLDSAYRWAKRFLGNQGGVRARLCRVRAPPLCPTESVHADLFEHLRLAFGMVSFAEAFQIRFQEPWPMKA